MKRLLFTSTLAIAVAACDAPQKVPSAPEIESAEHPLLVAVAAINASDLYEELDGLKVGQSVESALDLGELGVHAVDIERTPLVPDGFTADIVDARGEVTAISVPARSFRATSEADDLRLDFLVEPGRIAGVLRHEEQEYTLGGPDDDAAVVGQPGLGILRAPREEEPGHGDGVCGDPVAGTPWTNALDSTDQPTGTPRSQCWKLEVRTHADYEFFVGVGDSNYNTAVWKVLEGLVGGSKKFGVINLDLALPQGGGVTILTAPQNPLYYPTSHDSAKLLQQLGDFWNYFHPGVSRDAVLLFSGKNIHYNGNYANIGLAHLGEVCSDLNHSYAVVEARTMGMNTYNTVAHEVGHLLDAGHAGAGLMMAAIGSSDLQFSQSSRDQMNSHIWYHHACMPMAACTAE